MSYRPTIYKLAKGQENYLEIINHFITTWYEIEMKQCDFNSCDFEKFLGVKISKKLNEFLNYLTCLNYTLVQGKKRMIYTAIEYLFPMQNLKIGYDEDTRFFYLFQEERQDFYYGIPQEYLQEENPPVFRLIKNNKEIIQIEDNNLLEFLISHICVRASKIRVKSFGMFITKDDETRNKIEKVCKLFEYKTVFRKVTIFEKDNAIASIEKGDDAADILSINTWNIGEKEFMKQVIDILEWNGWSDNMFRYKM